MSVSDRNNATQHNTTQHSQGTAISHSGTSTTLLSLSLFVMASFVIPIHHSKRTLLMNRARYHLMRKPITKKAAHRFRPPPRDTNGGCSGYKSLSPDDSSVSVRCQMSCRRHDNDGCCLLLLVIQDSVSDSPFLVMYNGKARNDVVTAVGRKAVGANPCATSQQLLLQQDHSSSRAPIKFRRLCCLIIVRRLDRYVCI